MSIQPNVLVSDGTVTSRQLTNDEMRPFAERATDEYEGVEKGRKNSAVEAEELFYAFTADIINKRAMFTR